jgi:hypothetical protein
LAIFRPPPQPFVGGRQPLEGRQLPADLLHVEPPPVNDPPFNRRPLGPLHAILKSWEPRKLTEIYLSEIAESFTAPAEDPPFSGRDYRSGILRAWQPGPPAPQRKRPLQFVEEIVAAAADYPYTRDYSAILRSWQTRANPQQRTPRYIEEIIAPPVADYPYTRDQSAILRAWQARTAPLQRRPGYIESVDNPPGYSTAILQRIPRSWLPGPPAPQRLYPTQIVSVDDPPPRAPVVPIALRWKAPSWTVAPRVYYPHETLVAAADSPPFYRNLTPILRAWEPRKLTDIGASGISEDGDWTFSAQDQPPFGRRDWLPNVLRSWQPRRLTPIILQDVLDIVEGAPYVRDLTPILRHWQIPAPSPRQLRRFYTEQFIATADNPPFGSRDPLPNILRAWQPGPHLPKRKPPYGIEQPENNPPFGQRDPFPNILRAWQITPATKQRRPQYIIEAAVIADNPPFTSRDPRSIILRSWITPAAIRLRDYSRLIFPGIFIPEPEPEPEPTPIEPPIPAPLPFRSTHLEHSETYGATGMGSGPYGDTIWAEGTATAGGLASTHLEHSESYGATGMGSGPYGGTIWAEGTVFAGGFQTTLLEHSEAFGSGSIGMGSNPYGDTPWRRS